MLATDLPPPCIYAIHAGRDDVHVLSIKDSGVVARLGFVAPHVVLCGPEGPAWVSTSPLAFIYDAECDDRFEFTTFCGDPDGQVASHD